MFINVEKLSVEVKKLLNIVEKYNDICMNYYNTCNDASSYWSSPLSTRFFSDVTIEKNKLEMTISDLNNVISVYTYMIDSYGLIGKKIKYDLSNEERLNQLFNKYIEKIDSTLILYKTLELDSHDIQLIQQQKDVLENNKKRILEVRKYYNDLFNKIKEIEIEVKNKLKNLNIELVKETEIQQYL